MPFLRWRPGREGQAQPRPAGASLRHWRRSDRESGGVLLPAPPARVSVGPWGQPAVLWAPGPHLHAETDPSPARQLPPITAHPCAAHCGFPACPSGTRCAGEGVACLAAPRRASWGGPPMRRACCPWHGSGTSCCSGKEPVTVGVGVGWQGRDPRWMWAFHPDPGSGQAPCRLPAGHSPQRVPPAPRGLAAPRAG